MNEWYVWREERIYGPYDQEQLSAFLTPDTQVYHRQLATEWTPASSIPALKEILEGRVTPPLEWIIKREGRERPPISQSALVRMIEHDEIKAEHEGTAPKAAPAMPGPPAPSVARHARLGIRVAAATLVVVVPLWLGQRWYASSDFALQMKYGSPTADCAASESSSALCRKRPALCGCGTKGKCGLPSCTMYATLEKHGAVKR